MSADRIQPTNVSILNYEEFETQVRNDLPIGTPKDDVERYLARLGIVHSFVQRGSIVDENTFYGILENIGRAGPFLASLAIRIHLDENDKVQRIWFRVDYL